jgi:signal peptidase II
LGLATLVFALDRGLKYWVVEGMDLRNVGQIELWPPYLTLHMAWNEGINFGLFSSGSDITRWGLIGIGLAISLGLLLWFRTAKGFWLQAAVGLVVGGAIGNIYDRLTYGAVADFLNMSCCGIVNPYAFNLADISIFFGALGLVFLDTGPGRKKNRRPG